MEFDDVIIPANVSDTSITTTKETGFFTIEPEAPFSTVQIEEQLRKDVKNGPRATFETTTKIHDLTNKLL